MAGSFLRNVWYVAAWPEDVTETPLRRVVTGEPVVLFRLSDGTPAALLDICPHRWVPLSRGRVVEDQIECGYHGLRFDASGACTHNPHGEVRPANASVRRFPVVEMHGIVWIWMGDAEQADSARIPDFAVVGRGDHAIAKGSMRVDANVDLITDNLLDLSHVQYLHPQLRSPSGGEQRYEVRQEGSTVWSMRWRDRTLPNGLHEMFWPKDKLGDTRAHMRWDAPSVMFLDVGITECGAPVEEGVALPSVHLLTPETESSTHYFWGFLRNRRIEDADLTARIRSLGIQAFEGEDKPVIEAQQENGRIAERHRMRQVLLTPDAAAMRVRRVFAELLEAERVRG